MTTAQRNSIISPVAGLTIYNTDTNQYNYYDGSAWQISLGPSGPTGPTGANGTNGVDGATGPTGANGTNGTNGVDGATGPTGANGINGATGPTGANGATGPSGSVNSVTASGNIASSGGANPNITFTGVLPILNGGTNSGTALSGNSIMVSNGTGIVQGQVNATATNKYLTQVSSGAPIWNTIAAADLPNLAAMYIQNTSIQQAASNFNISGTGTVAGLFSLGTASSVSGRLIFLNTNAFTTTFQPSSLATASATYTLPTAPPSTNNNVLQSTTGGVLTWNALSNSTPVSNSVCSANVTDNTAGTGTVVPGMSFNIAANETWSFEMHVSGIDDGNANNGIQFGLTTPGGSTIEAALIGTRSSLTSQATARITTSGTLTPMADQYISSNNLWGLVQISGVVVNGGTAGTVQLIFSSTQAGRQVTIYKNSYITARRIAP